MQHAISWGVSRGLFAYCTGTPDNFDNIHIDEQLSSAQCVISEHAWLLDASIARTLTAPSPVPNKEGDHGSGLDSRKQTTTDDPKPPVDIKKENQNRCTNIGVEIELGSSNWRQFHASVIKPLVDKGADINISVRMSAIQIDGFDRDFVELSIRESVLQLNRNARIKTDKG